MKSKPITLFAFLIITGIALSPQIISAEEHDAEAICDVSEQSDSNGERNCSKTPLEINSEKIMIIYPGQLCGVGTEFKDGLCVVTPKENTATPPDYNLGYTQLLFLLFLYYLPAQTIERVMEVFDISRLRGCANTVRNLESHLETLKSIRANKFLTNSDYKITSSDLQVPKANKETKKSSVMENTSKISLSSVDSNVTKTLEMLGKSKSNRTLYFFSYGFGLSLAPALTFTHFGIGPLYVIESLFEGDTPFFGFDEWWMDVYNTVINAAFISSGTQPIHKIIDLIPKIRKTS